MDKKKYRWVICAGCTLMFFCTAGLGMTGFSVYQPYLISEGGLTNAQASMLTSVRSLFTFLTMFVSARVLNKTDLRLGGTLSVFGITLSLELYGIAENFSTYVMAAAVAGICYGIGGMLAVSVMIHRWFDDHEGLAVGICSAGSGFSAVIGTPLITWAIETFSMKKAFFMEAGIVAFFGIIVYMVLRNRPLGEERPPQFVSKSKKRNSQETMLWIGKRETVFIIVGILLMGFTYAATSHISVLYKNSGFGTGEVSFLVSVMGAALFWGKCIYGEAVDKMGSFRSGNIFFSMLIFGSGLCCLAENTELIFASTAVALVSCGSVLLSVGLTVISNEIAKQEYYAVIVRRIQIIYMMGSMIFGVVPGLIADQTGSYIPAFVMITIFAVISAVLVQSVLYKRCKE